jgi:hypothetical protein
MRESMVALRPVNARLLNLTGRVVSKIHFSGGRLEIQFDAIAPGSSVFRLQLGGVLRFIDRGLISQPLTTGLVWDIAGRFGRANALPVPRKSYKGLIELILDYQGQEQIHRRFQAVAHSAVACDGPVADGLWMEGLKAAP